MEQELAWVQDMYAYIATFIVNYGLQLVGAIFILIIGVFVSRKGALYVQKILLRHNVDITLSQFASGTVRILILATVVFVALTKIGIEVTPFIAAVGALSLGAGLALQGTLSNYGAGIAIIISRPFLVGDTISVQGVSGIVKQVKLSCTILTNEDEVKITIPNKNIVGEIIHNSAHESIIESSVDIAYSSDPELAIRVITQACASIENVNPERVPQVGIAAFADSGITIELRYWVPTEKLFQTRYKVNSAIFAALQAHHLEIPFPQREVRMLSENG